MNKICVLGSINMDMAVYVNDMPQKGETIIASGYKRSPGGKGANQALAARRLGAEVFFIGKVGNDSDSDLSIENLINDGVNVQYLLKDNEAPTGLAIIAIDKSANNSIMVIPGANMTISPQQIKESREIIKKSDILAAQLEISIDAIGEAFEFAHKCGVTTLLNTAPVKPIPDEIFKTTDILIANEIEITALTDIVVTSRETAIAAGNKLITKGVRFVIITLGENGAVLVTGNDFCSVPAYRVDPVDTTAAGDAFIGALCSKLAKVDGNISYIIIKKAIPFANYVSSIVIQREGAQVSLPYLDNLRYSESDFDENNNT